MVVIIKFNGSVLQTTLNDLVNKSKILQKNTETQIDEGDISLNIEEIQPHLLQTISSMLSMRLKGFIITKRVAVVNEQQSEILSVEPSIY